MSSGRRRPGTAGAAVLLLLGTLSLSVGVLLGLDDDGADRAVVARDLGAVPGWSGSATPRPLSATIPVLTPLPGTSGVDVPSGGFDAVVPPSGTGVPPSGTVVPAAGPGVAPRRIEPTPQLADPVPTWPPPRPAPQPLPVPPPPLGPQQPGLLSPVHPLPAPPRTTAAPLVPAVLELPARSVTAPVDAVGTAPSGGMVVPEAVRTVGWWAPGVLPGGATGSAVVAGHVDSRTQGVGVLAVLPRLTEGEPVLVRDAAGRTVSYRVAARREYGKYDLPRDVFRRDGPPRLVLITCGGRFDPAAGSYESNIVVYAVPA